MYIANNVDDSHGQHSIDSRKSTHEDVKDVLDLGLAGLYTLYCLLEGRMVTHGRVNGTKYLLEMNKGYSH